MTNAQKPYEKMLPLTVASSHLLPTFFDNTMTLSSPNMVKGTYFKASTVSKPDGRPQAAIVVSYRANTPWKFAF